MDFGFGLTFGNVSFSWSFLRPLLLKFSMIAMFLIIGISIWELQSKFSKKSIWSQISISAILFLSIVIRIIAEIMTGEKIIYTMVQLILTLVNVVWHMSILRRKNKSENEM